MNTVQLECSVTVAEHLNFSKASRVLKITQPAVSHQIRTLEEELNVKLFQRSSKNVTLTQEGVLFLSDARLILKTAYSAKERLGMHEQLQPLELGCHNYMELNLFPPILKILSEEFPLLRPTIRLVPFPSLLELVEKGQIQAVLGTRDTQKKPSLYFRKLCLAPIACVCAPDHPLAGRTILTSSDLAGNFIACSPRHVSDSVFAVQSSVLNRLPAEKKILTESVESAFALAKARMGYTLYPDIFRARDSGLRYIPVSDLPKVSFGVYCQYNHDQPILKRFLALMSDYLRENCCTDKEKETSHFL